MADALDAILRARETFENALLFLRRTTDSA